MKLMHNFFYAQAMHCHKNVCDLRPKKLKCIREFMKITYCLIVYFSIFTGFIFTFSVNLAHINARNNTKALCKKHILSNSVYFIVDKNITYISFLHSILFKPCVNGTLSLLLGCMGPSVDMGR